LSIAHSQLVSPLALALLLKPLSFYAMLFLLLLFEKLGSSLKLLSFCSCSYLSFFLLLLFKLTSLNLVDLVRQPESSTTVVQILALLLVIKSLS
jgi:hypothetical protein